VSVFILDNEDGNSLSSKTLSVKIDSKGRISIPSFLRKNLNLKSGDSLELLFNLKNNYFIVQNVDFGRDKNER